VGVDGFEPPTLCL